MLLTVDVDVLDPAFAPGTGTPEPGGLTPRSSWGVRTVASSLDLVGADVVEVAPTAAPRPTSPRWLQTASSARH